jgi:divalent metal cation (Fe/Co/Zn/Cd) transporter
MSVVLEPRDGLVRQARLAQTITVGWMVVELVAALAAGVAAHSVALTAFGIDSAIEIFTAVIVLRQLAQRTGGASQTELDARERQASRLVGWGLYALIVYIVVTSAVSLATAARPTASMPGLVLAAVALCVMPVLWRWRLRLSERLRSAALRADAACSLVCIYLSAVLAGGLLLNRLAGVWWADPLAAVAMVWWIHGEAREALEAASVGRRDD